MAEPIRPDELTIAELSKVYTGLADELLERESFSRILGDRAKILGFENNFKTTHEVKISVLDISKTGFLDYNGHYPVNKLSTTTKTYKMGNDRALKIIYDKLKESDKSVLGMSLTYAMNKITRNKAVPEVDAYNFAKIYQQIKSPTDFTKTTKMLDTIDSIVDAIFDKNGIPNDQLVLFVNTTVGRKIKQELADKKVYFSASEITANGYKFNVPTYEDIPIIQIPKSRFYTKLKLYQESEYETTDTNVGYAKDPTAGKDIAFLLLPRDAYLPLMKFEEIKIAPDSVTNTLDRNNSAALNMIYDGLYDDILYPDMVYGMKMADDYATQSAEPTKSVKG